MRRSLWRTASRDSRFRSTRPRAHLQTFVGRLLHGSHTRRSRARGRGHAGSGCCAPASGRARRTSTCQPPRALEPPCHRHHRDTFYHLRKPAPALAVAPHDHDDVLQALCRGSKRRCIVCIRSSHKAPCVHLYAGCPALRADVCKFQQRVHDVCRTGKWQHREPLRNTTLNVE